MKTSKVIFKIIGFFFQFISGAISTAICYKHSKFILNVKQYKSITLKPEV